MELVTILNAPYKPENERCETTGRFKKQHKPWNKGMKGLDIGGKETQFKPGHLPHNTKADGVISQRKHKRDGRTYLYIRISKGNWMLLNRYIWTKHHGEIPPKHVIIHKDGNTLNCNIDNLDCISMAENAQRNRNRKKFSKTMKEMWQREKLRKQYGMRPLTKLRVR